jgi:hypothetical protein
MTAPDGYRTGSTDQPDEHPSTRVHQEVHEGRHATLSSLRNRGEQRPVPSTRCIEPRKDCDEAMSIFGRNP